MVARHTILVRANYSTIHAARGRILHTIPAVNNAIVVAPIPTIIIATGNVVFIHALRQHQQVAVCVGRLHAIVAKLTIWNCRAYKIVTAQVCASDNSIVDSKKPMIFKVLW